MEEITTYYVDENIISILSNPKDEAELKKIKNGIDDKVFQKIQDTVKQYLLSKGLSEDQAKFISDTDWEKLSQDWQKYLKEPELLNNIEIATESVFKEYFIENFPKLSPDDQSKVVSYVNQAVVMLQAINEEGDELEKTRQEMLNKYNVTTYEELVAKIKVEQAVNTKKNQEIPATNGVVPKQETNTNPVNSDIPIQTQSSNDVTNNSISDHLLQGLQTVNQTGTSPLLKKILDDRVKNLSQSK